MLQPSNRSFNGCGQRRARESDAVDRFDDVESKASAA